MSNYIKAISAGITIAVLIGKRQFGFDLSGGEDAILEIVVGLAGLYSVWRFPNKSKAA